MQTLLDNIKKFFGGESWDKVKRFCAKNKRYFAAALLFVILVLILVKFAGTSNHKVQDSTEDSTSVSNFEIAKDFDTDSNDELKELLTEYLKAYAAGNLETLETLATPISDNEKSYVGVFSQYIEEYRNMNYYSKPGLTEGSYLVSVSYDLKFYGVDTVAPGLEFYYVETDKDGKLFINNLYSSYNLGRGENELDPSIYSIIIKYEKQEDVVALQKQIETAYSDAVASDVNLATMLTSTIPTAMNTWVNSLTPADSTEQTEQDTQSSEQSEATQSTSEQQTSEQPASEQPAPEPAAPVVTKVQVIDNAVNLRETPSADGNLLGQANSGETYTKLGTDGDWTQIDYNGTNAYVKSEFVQDVAN